MFFKHRQQLPTCAIFLLLSVAEWIVAQVLEYISVSFQAKLLWNKLQFVGIAILPVAWLGFCFEYLSYKKFIKLKYFLLFGLIPILFLVLLFTNHFHHLIWKNSFLSANTEFLHKEYNIFFWIFIGYTYTLLSWGFIMLLYVRFKSRHLYRSQSTAILIAASFPIVASIIDVTGIITQYDITPVAFSITSFILIYGFARLQFNDTVPVAYQTAIESMSDLVIVLDKNNNIFYANPAAAILFEQKKVPIQRKEITHFIPHLLPVIKKTPYSKLETIELELKKKIYDVKISPILDWRQRSVSNIIVLREITQLKRTEDKLRKITQELEIRVKNRTKELIEANEALNAEIKERKKAEEIIRAALGEKEVLLKELYHRVKNNLQIIISIIKLKSRHIRDKKTRTMFLETSNRVKSIGIVHEKLCKSGDLTKIAVSEYFENLANFIFKSLDVDRQRIRLHINVEKIFLDIDTCISCGLIINELITNSIKYAFPNNNEDKLVKDNNIKIDFYTEKDDFILAVSDNGIGLDKNKEIEDFKTLGLEIVRAIINQLRGIIEINRDKGLSFKVRFSKINRMQV